MYKAFPQPARLTTRWVDIAAGLKRAGHLIGEIKGKKENVLLLIGHIIPSRTRKQFLAWTRKIISLGTRRE